MVAKLLTTQDLAPEVRPSKINLWWKGLTARWSRPRKTIHVFRLVNGRCTLVSSRVDESEPVPTDAFVVMEVGALFMIPFAPNEHLQYRRTLYDAANVCALCFHVSGRG